MRGSTGSMHIEQVVLTDTGLQVGELDDVVLHVYGRYARHGGDHVLCAHVDEDVQRGFALEGVPQLQTVFLERAHGDLRGICRSRIGQTDTDMLQIAKERKQQKDGIQVVSE